MNDESRDWVFEGSYSYGKPFSRADVRDLIAAVGRPLPAGEVEGRVEDARTGQIEMGHVPRETALWQRLNNTRMWAGIQKQEAEKPGAAELRDRFARIVNAVAELKQALGVPAAPGPNEWDMLDRPIWQPLMQAYSFEHKPLGTLRHIIASLADLARWAELAKSQAPPSKTASTMNRNEGRRELTALFGGLARIWTEIWGGEPTRYLRDPFALFCRLVLDHIGVTLVKRQLRHQLSKVAVPLPD